MSTKSGRFVLRLPKSLHAALSAEATREGVSMNQLIVAKLAATLGQTLRTEEGFVPAERFVPPELRQDFNKRLFELRESTRGDHE